MKTIFKGSVINIFLHLIVWMILFLLPVYFVSRWQVEDDFILFYYISMLISCAVFYTNYFILVPKYFYKTKRYKYYISVGILLVFFYFVTEGSISLVFSHFSKQPNSEEALRSSGTGSNINPADRNRLIKKPSARQLQLFNYTFNSIFLIFFSVGLRAIERQSKTETIKKDLEKEKLNSELTFLKNQISPHFFFNTLNNIYSLVGINSDESQKAILKLSKLMRYMLYETEQSTTLLSKEIEFMNNYIDLMRLRMTDQIILSVDFPAKFEDISIPPLLFIPYIENAFKHGISYQANSFIKIKLIVEDNMISFRCANSISQAKDNTDNQHSGIGLENVNKRLCLLFPDKHKLSIKNSESLFEVCLDIWYKPGAKGSIII